MRRSMIAAVGAGVVACLLWAVYAVPLHAQQAETAPAAASGPAAGTNCVVYLRGDATGTAFHDRIPALGNLVELSGTVAGGDATYLVLKAGPKQYYLPRTSIALIETK